MAHRNDKQKNEVILEISDLIEIGSDEKLRNLVERFASEKAAHGSYDCVIASIRQVSKYCGKEVAAKIVKNTFGMMYDSRRKNDKQ